MIMANALLEVKNLKTRFDIESGFFYAVDGVSFQVQRGRTLGIVGESGCGKSVTSLSLMRLVQKPGRIESGEILFDGRALLQASDREMQDMRGKDLAMIFQDPMTSLNPVYTIGHQIDEAVRRHNPKMSRAEVKAHTINMLKKVGIPAPERRYDDYPHQLSGGMRQRVMIAMAISCDPKLLIADEPTTALDVTIQAQILDLLRNLQKDFDAGLILITHDLGVVAEMCQDVVVMYAGRIVEQGSVEDIFYHPRHPYTRGLLDSIPNVEDADTHKRLRTIPGLVPDLSKLPKGCRFADRCPRVQARCRESDPALTAHSETQSAACYFPLEGGTP